MDHRMIEGVFLIRIVVFGVAIRRRIRAKRVMMESGCINPHVVEIRFDCRPVIDHARRRLCGRSLSEIGPSFPPSSSFGCTITRSSLAPSSPSSSLTLA